MWKDFFYYSRSERRAILVLLAVVICLLATVLIGRLWFPDTVPVGVSEDKAIDSFLTRVKERERRFMSYGRKESFREDSVPVVLHCFDPNTADSLSLRRLGLSVFVTRNILSYREKGGVFRTPDSFSRIYGLSAEQFRQLKPYVLIADVFQQRDTFRQSSARRAYPAKYPEGTVVDLNLADTAELRRIPGIGSGLAGMIVAYRSRLGGFCRVEQLKEIPYLPQGIGRWFVLRDTVPFKKLSVNTCSLDKLRRHPYMDFYKAKVIIEYRRKRGKIKSLSQLSMFEEFSEKDLERLSPYLSFE